MKMRLLTLIVAVLCAPAIQAQSEIVLTAAAPPAVTNFGGAYVGAPGGVTNIYYWIVARYPPGTSAAVGPLVIGGTNGRQNLSAANLVNLGWNAMPDAAGYDVLWGRTNTFPALPCVGCAVVVNTALTTLVDTGVAFLAYAGPAAAGEAELKLTLANRDEALPYGRAQVDGATRRLVLGTPLLPADGCGEWAGGLLGSTGIGCIAGAPVQSVFGRIGHVVATAGDYTAAQVTNVPAGTIAAITVQAALDELDTEKAAHTDIILGRANMATVGVVPYVSMASTLDQTDLIFLLANQIGIGPLNAAPSGTLDVLDRTAATGATLMQVGWDGANTSVLSTRLEVREGATQGAVDPFEVVGPVGATYLAVDTGGNVGINTATPRTPLEVAGANNAMILAASGPRLYYATDAAHRNWRVSAQDVVSNSWAVSVGDSNDVEPLDDVYTAVLTTLSSGQVGIGTTKPGGTLDVHDTSVVGTESLAAPANFGAPWVLAGEFALVVTDAVYTFAGAGAGTVTQPFANLAIDTIESRRYRLRYTISASTMTDGAFTLTNTTALAALPLAMTVAAHTYYFESAVAPGAFIFDVVGATGGSFTITDASLMQIQGGDVVARGMVRLNAITFADLPAARNGDMVYCVDCNAAGGAGYIACASTPGTGAVAVYISGAWSCGSQ